MDQAGFIPQTDIFDNIFKTLDIIQYCKQCFDTPIVILLLDIEKAFDQVESTYLLKLLEHMGFGPNFLMAIQSIYKDPSARVCLNGFTSSSFHIKRGTQQGCPLSPLLFALALEPLAETLRHDNLTGIQIKRKHYKLS